MEPEKIGCANMPNWVISNHPRKGWVNIPTVGLVCSLVGCEQQGVVLQAAVWASKVSPVEHQGRLGVFELCCQWHSALGQREEAGPTTAAVTEL